MISDAMFFDTMTYLLELLPMQKALSSEAKLMLWDTFPATAKLDLTREMLMYAAGQRMLDPEPPKEAPLHLSLLRYLYPLENNRGAVERGLRKDLRDRMQRTEIFHDPQPARHEQTPATELRRLAPSGYWTPESLSDDQIMRHIEVIKRQVEALDIDPKDDPLTLQQLKEGKKWFKDALKGYWTLKADAGGIATGWVVRSRREALRLINEALGIEDPIAEAALPPPPGQFSFRSAREQREWMIAELARQRENDQGGYGGPLVVEGPTAEPEAITVETVEAEPELISAGIGEVEAW